ncbi:MAG: Ig-like domain-containing protein [Deltaproteobacteria bacterium]|nr:Ig-like domain-containing protein [Kofleriaceae bacterium]
MKTQLTTALLLGLFVGAGAGCSSDDAGPRPPEEGDAFLTIVGETNVFMENGWQQAIIVRYHDGDNNPLAGEVDFAIGGSAAGGTLSAPSAITDRDGEATVTVNAGANGDAAFTVSAVAEYAEPVSWRIAVRTEQPNGPLDPQGTYRVSSNFDLVSGLPGTIGQVTNTFIDMTDSPYDPATFLLDQAVASISDSTTRAFINGARPALDAIVNDALLAASPTIVTDILEVGNDFGQVARKFGTQSTLEVAAASEGFAAKHTLTHVVFTVDGASSQFLLSDLGMANLEAPNLGYQQTDDRTDIAQHQFPLSYGTVLLVALNEVIIPAIDPSANNLQTFFTNLVDCDYIGAEISDYIGFGSPSLYAGACRLGIGYASNYVEGRIRSLDSSALLLNISGNARPMDTNTDRKIDILQNGTWTGSMSYANQPVTLGTSTFRGDRVVGPN